MKNTITVTSNRQKSIERSMFMLSDEFDRFDSGGRKEKVLGNKITRSRLCMRYFGFLTI